MDQIWNTMYEAARGALRGMPGADGAAHAGQIRRY